MTLQIGDRLPDWHLESVSREKMKTMAALLADSNPIHFDLDSVRALGMGDRPINQGPNNLAYVMNMLGSWAGGMQHVRRVKVRFQANVRGDDHVVARGTVTGLRVEGDRQLAECDVELVVLDGDADGETALRGSATVDVTSLAEVTTG